MWWAGGSDLSIALSGRLCSVRSSRVQDISNCSFLFLFCHTNNNSRRIASSSTSRRAHGSTKYLAVLALLMDSLSFVDNGRCPGLTASDRRARWVFADRWPERPLGDATSASPAKVKTTSARLQSGSAWSRRAGVLNFAWQLITPPCCRVPCFFLSFNKRF